MFIYLSKKIAIPNGVKICSLSWNAENGWIACGGENGLLKVLKMEANKANGKGPIGVAASTSLTMNQTLDGHSGGVVCLAWNACYRKLTTSDKDGLIIVWMLQRGVWVEEMINNRNKSVVKDMKWTSDGQKICIVYEDGAVIVGSVDGNRLWGKEIPHQLALVEWSPDGKNILFLTSDGEIFMYDNSGNKNAKLLLHAVENEANYSIVALDWYNGVGGYVSEDAPSLAIAFRGGIVQVGRGELDDEPIIIDTGMELKTCRWNSNGSVLALAGIQSLRSSSGSVNDINVVQFYTPYGIHLKSLKVPGNKIEALSWEGGGLRMCLAVDSHIYFANIRPKYKWGYFSNTLVYCFYKPEVPDACVIFWDTCSDERYTKYVRGVLALVAAGENCVIAAANPDHPGQYLLTLCDTIGSPVDCKVTTLCPKYLTMTEYHVIAASDSAVYTWQYRTPVSKLTSIETENKNSFRRKEGRERIFYIDDLPEIPPCEASAFEPRLRDDVQDPISAICASANCLIVGRASGKVHRYTLPHISLEAKYLLRCRPQVLALNSVVSRMSIIDINNVLSFYDLDVPSTDGNRNGGGSGTGEHLDFEKKDVWDIVWAADNPELCVIMEKTKLTVLRNLDPEEPIVTSGYLCSYKELQVKAAMLDEIMISPEQPEISMVVDFQTRSLREAHEVLNVGLQEAFQYISDHPHQRLWKLLAEAALEEMDFSMAERAFVKCKDYSGIRIVKRLCMLNDRSKQKAEVEAYFQRFDVAESLYREMDRKDLAIELRIRLGDWFRVVQLVQSGGGNDKLLTLAWNRIGDYYADRQKWSKSAQYYSQAKNTYALINSYYTLEDFDKIEEIAATLPDESPLMHDLGKRFRSVGLTESAAKVYLRNNDIKAAIDSCVLLNDWDRAVELAESHNFPQIEGLLSKYGAHLMEKGKALQAIELYRRANRSTEAANLLSTLAQQVGRGGCNPVRSKRLHVLAALELERFRKKVLNVTTMGGGMTAAQTTAATLDSLMQHDAATGENKSLDNAWRGAEAYHLFLLAHRQLYKGSSEDALKTSLKLYDYDDVLNAKEVYSLIALTAYYTGYFEQCSKAFIKLESLSSLTEKEKGLYSDMSMKFFSKSIPNDPPTENKLQCPTCRQNINHESSSCAKCNRIFQICMASGAFIIDQRTYTCRTCRHLSIEHELRNSQACPLCHSTLT